MQEQAVCVNVSKDYHAKSTFEENNFMVTKSNICSIIKFYMGLSLKMSYIKSEMERNDQNDQGTRLNRTNICTSRVEALF